MRPEVRARAIGLFEDLARSDWGQLVAASVRWVRRQLHHESFLVCHRQGCPGPAVVPDHDGGAGGICAAHVSFDDYARAYLDGRRDAVAGDTPMPEPGWAAAAASRRDGAGGAYLVGYTDGYLGTPMR